MPKLTIEREIQSAPMPPVGTDPAAKGALGMAKMQAAHNIAIYSEVLFPADDDG